MTRQQSARGTAAGLTAGRGRGPGGQSMAALQPGSRCPVTGCEEQIDPSRLMCRKHWYRVPRQLRDRVWATWRSGEGILSAEHQEAVLAAIGTGGGAVAAA